MANNIDAGMNFVTAKVTATWEAVGLTSSNTLEVYGTAFGNPVSWRPNKTINTLQGSGIVSGKGYSLNSKIARDLTAYFGILEPAVFNSVF